MPGFESEGTSEWCKWCGNKGHKCHSNRLCEVSSWRPTPGAIERAYCECGTSRCYRPRGCRMRGRLSRRLRACLLRLEWMSDLTVIQQRRTAFANHEESPRHWASVHSLNSATTTSIIVVNRPDVATHWCPRSRQWIRRRLVVFEQCGKRLRRLPDWPHMPPAELPGRALRIRVVCD